MAIVRSFTDFNEGSFDGWQKDANGVALAIAYEQDTGSPRNGFLRFPDDSATIHGNIIHQRFSGLEVGETYRFSARVRRYRKPERPGVFDLHFLLGNDWDTFFGRFGIEDDRWHRVTADFVAQAADQIIRLAARHSGGVIGGLIDIDDLRFGQPSDITDFEASGMNDWALGGRPAENAGIVSAPGGNRVLNFPTPTGLGYNGKVLSRSFKVLQGLNYKFSFRAQDAVPSARDRATISVRMNGSVIIPEFVVDGAGQWLTKEGSFVAPTNQVSIEFFNGTSDGTDGNDFNLDDLRLVEL
ncbi:carbohydrate binding domain-containing protein [Pseudomonas vranovensis]|nr:carbohydrate binding domain-containing protein [Pseudomonas vranovensis]